MESNKNKLIWNIEPKGMPLIIRNGRYKEI